MNIMNIHLYKGEIKIPNKQKTRISTSFPTRKIKILNVF